MDLPTARLPPIAAISNHSTDDLLAAVDFLRALYIPDVRGSRRRRSSNPPPQLAVAVRADPFERAYAIRWLSALIALPVPGPLLDRAASLLAVCAGTAGAGSLSRSFIFPTGPASPPVRVHLADAPLDNQHYESVGAQTWGGACVLSEAIAEHPALFSLLPDRRTEQLRILELGAGTGLVSLTVGKLLQSFPDRVHSVDIVATDFYPAVLANLRQNIAANFTDDPTLSVRAHPLDWAAFSTSPDVPEPPLDRPFDLVLGSDIVYEAQHATWIKACIARLLRKPTAQSQPLFHLVIPLRSTHAAESLSVDQVFPTRASRAASAAAPELVVFTRETILCDTDDDLRAADVEYAYYKIGWW